MSDAAKWRVKDEEKHRQFLELYRSDVSIYPSYGRLAFPYDVICRERLARTKRQYAAQFNREINHVIAMKMRAVDGIRVDLLFSIKD